MLDILQKIYEISAERLRYAESKNGAMLAVNSLIFFKVLESSLGFPQSRSLLILYCLSILFFSTTILICSVSFIAQLNIPKMMKQRKRSFTKKNMEFDNLISSLKMAQYLPNDYVAKLAHKHNQPNHKPSPLEVDYAEHIIVNAKVILFKFNCFRTAMVCMISGLFFVIIIKILSI